MSSGNRLEHVLPLIGGRHGRRSAVTSAVRLEPDLLVLDIAMPGLNEIAAAAIRQGLAGGTFVSPSITR